MAKHSKNSISLRVELKPEDINTLAEVLNEAVTQIDLKAPTCVLNLIVEQNPSGKSDLLLAVSEGSISEGGKLVGKGSVITSRYKFDKSTEFTEK